MQIIFAGKAHPQDLPAKELIRTVIHFASDPKVRNQMVFLEDYDINVARYLVQGVDVWLNTPRRPLEASGTSGMKAAANGALNVSVLDGWWDEGYSPDVGWAIGSGEVYGRPGGAGPRGVRGAVRPARERNRPDVLRARPQRPAARLDRHDEGVDPQLGAFFNTQRMVREYTESCYLPAHRAGVRLSADRCAPARSLAEWRARVTRAWPGVSVRVDEIRKHRDMQVGETVGVTIRVRLGELTPDDVSVEVRHGAYTARGEIREGTILAAVHEKREGDEEVYRVEVPCVEQRPVRVRRPGPPQASRPGRSLHPAAPDVGAHPGRRLRGAGGEVTRRAAF